MSFESIWIRILWDIWIQTRMIQFNTHQFKLITITHKNTLLTGCPVKRVHISFPTASGWGIFPISQLFPQPTCFPLASGWGIFPISQLFPQHACFSAASGWGIFPIFQLFPQHACFPIASGWGIFPISQLFPHLTTQTNEKRQPTFIDCLKL